MRCTRSQTLLGNLGLGTKLSMRMTEDRSQKMQFLWNAAHSYAATCPSLSAHLMTTFNQSDQKEVSDARKQSFCPSCGWLFTPASSSVRGVGRRRVRRKRRRCQLRGRDLEWLVRPPGCGRKKPALLIHCRACWRSYLTARNLPSNNTISGTPIATPTRRSKVTSRPHPSPFNKSRSSRRRSSTLKALLRESSEHRRQSLTPSPSLSLFLMTL